MTKYLNNTMDSHSKEIFRHGLNGDINNGRLNNSSIVIPTKMTSSMVGIDDEWSKRNFYDQIHESEATKEKSLSKDITAPTPKHTKPNDYVSPRGHQDGLAIYEQPTFKRRSVNSSHHSDQQAEATK